MGSGLKASKEMEAQVLTMKSSENPITTELALIHNNDRRKTQGQSYL